MNGNAQYPLPIPQLSVPQIPFNVNVAPNNQYVGFPSDRTVLPDGQKHFQLVSTQTIMTNPMIISPPSDLPIREALAIETSAAAQNQIPAAHKKDFWLFSSHTHTDRERSTILSVILLVLFEILMIVMYAIFVRFYPQASDTNYVKDEDYTYTSLQDINVMVFVGFGFLMCYLRHYGWSSLGFCLLFSAICVQLYVLISHFWICVFSGVWTHVWINHTRLVWASFSAASLLISYGGLIGTASVAQVLLMAIVHNIAYGLNEGIVFHVLKTQDIGGSGTIHLFGGVFGVAATFVMWINRSYPVNHEKMTSTYDSNIISFIGSLFLWIYWPSFNSALALSKAEQTVASVNTTLSLTASVITTMIVSPMFNHGKYSIEEVLNATIAGGVIVGASCNWIHNPALAISLGVIGGVVASLGFRFLTTLLKEVKIYDTVGIVNLHLLPGFLGAILSAFTMALWFEEEGGRGGSAQAGIQVAATFISLGIALAAGILAGLIMRLVPRITHPFQDHAHWHFEESHS